VCTAGCTAGFRGEASSTCSNAGTWSPVQGGCKRVTCEGAPTEAAPANSRDWPETCSGLAAGSECSASCSEGYRGSHVSSCTAEGGWSPVEGGCEQGAH
jgi:hypothetical protein